MSDMETYYWYKEHKICVTCHQQEAFGKYTRCRDCLYKHNEYFHKLSKEDRLKITQRNAELLKQRLANGLCARCNQPICNTSKRFCEKHLVEHRLQSRKYSRKHKVYKTVEELEAIQAEKMEKMKAGFIEYQKTERAKINNAKYSELCKKKNKRTFGR